MVYTSDIWKEKDRVDLKKHKDLWNDVLYGTPAASLAAAGKLHELGEMGEKTLQVFMLASAIASTKR